MITCFECGVGMLQEASLSLEGTRNGEVFSVSMVGLKCDACGFQTLDSTQMSEFTHLVTDAYRRKYGLLTGSEIRQRRARLGLTQQQFADYLGVGVASVKRWENGQVQEKGLDELIRIKTDPQAARRNLEALEQSPPRECILTTVVLGPERSWELRFSLDESIHPETKIRSLPVQFQDYEPTDDAVGPLAA